MISRILLLGFCIAEFFSYFELVLLLGLMPCIFISFPSDLLNFVMHKHRIVDPPCI